MSKRHLKHTLNHVILPGFILSGFIGLCVGVTIYFYKMLAEYILEKGSSIVLSVKQNYFWLFLVIPVIICLGLIMSITLKHNSEIKGGGIPTSEGIIRGALPYYGLKTLILLPIMSLITFMCGLPLGTEGPSVAIGTCLSEKLDTLFNRKNPVWKRYILTGGASASFAVATCAPITGIIFALEEIHKKFSPMIMIFSFSATVFASTVAFVLSKAFGKEFIFISNFSVGTLKLKYYYHLVIFSVLVALLALLFNILLKISHRILSKNLKNVPFSVKVITIMLINTAIVFMLPDFFGSGHSLIEKLASNQIKVGIILLLLVLKMIMISFSSSSGITGGMFIPVLLIGALIGALYARIFKLDEYLILFIAIGMASFMSSQIACPLSGLVFSIEGLSCLNNLVPLIICVFISYVLSHMLNIHPIYELILDRKLKGEYGSRNFFVGETSIVVKDKSFAIGKQVRDLLFSANILVLSVKRENKDYAKMDNFQDKIIHKGDTVNIRFQSYDINQTKEELESFMGIQDSFTYETIQE